MPGNILPANSTIFERALAAAMPLPQFDPTDIKNLWSADFCPEKLIHELAWSLSIDAWSPDWSLAVKRSQIKQSAKIHRAKGTVSSVKAIVAGFGGSLLLREWWETTPKGTPRTFSLTLALSDAAGGAPTPEYLSQVLAAIDAVKPISAHYTFTLTNIIKAEIGVAAVARGFSFSRIDGVIMPEGAENLTYLTDQFGNFLTNQYGNYLVAN